MNADSFRYLYNYHFAENRKMWDNYIAPLSQEQFLHDPGYSRGSVRDQVVHIIHTDEAWFGGLRDVDLTNSPDLAGIDDRQRIRAYWDEVEETMRGYLAGLDDAALFNQPFPPGEDGDLILWQVLLHVANHGTDHRAQILRQLSDLGVATTSQDFIFYVYDNP